MMRLRDAKTLRMVYREGKKSTSADLTLLYLRNKYHQCNYAIHVGKRFGNSVRRNRIKRIFRELLRQFKGKWVGYDIVVRPKKKADELSFDQLFQRLQNVFIEAAIPNRK